MLPDFSMEAACMARGALRVAGVDEVGRGPLAGPVTAAAVVLDPMAIPEGLNDSKQLSAARRQALAAQLRSCAHIFVAHASVDEIDHLNILQASLLAMQRAVAGLAPAPDRVLVDGRHVPQALAGCAQTVVGGDGRCLSIAAASIVAKVARDQIMVDLAQQHPGYGWETNMGYGTKSHMSALQILGATPHHRRTFKPVHNIL
ncbi:MAG: ribonuclease HII [Pseudomonadota bacterium]